MKALKKTKVPFLIFYFFCCSLFAISQDIPIELQKQLEGKNRLVDIMKLVDTYYNFGRENDLIKNSKDNEDESPYIHWKRFENFYMNRLNPDGTIPENVAKLTWDNWNNYKKNNPQFFTQNIQQNASYGSWSNYGPTTIIRYGEGWNSGYGRVNCIAFHPTDGNTFYIGLPQGGIWRTTDGGVNWSVVTDDIPSVGISGLVVSWANANTLYALTGDGDVSAGGFVTSYGYDQKSVGVLKSIDGGANWTITGDLPNAGTSYYGYKLIQHPTLSNTLFAATTTGIYRTTNGGSSWTQVETDTRFTDIEFKPGDPNTMYAVRRMQTAGGTNTNPFYRSTDGGATWSSAGITGLTSTAERLAIGVSAANSSYVYLLAGPSTGAGTFKGVYRSTNSGVDFTSRAIRPNILGYPTAGTDAKDQAFYDLCIEVDPGNANTIMTGGINIWRSTDGGTILLPETQWRDDGDDVPPGDYVHADVHNITYNKLNGYVYSCSDGGVSRSTNDGASWTFLSADLQIMATYHADWYEPNDDILVNGAQDNGVNNRFTASNTYRHIQGADGFDAVIDQNNPLDMVVSWNGSIVRTTDGGLNTVGRTPTDCGTFPTLARSFSDDNDIFAADGSNVYRSTNRGTNWTTESTPAGSRALTTCPSNSNRVYASNGATLWRSDDKGDTWATISGTTNYPTGMNVTDIEPRPSSSIIIWASFGGYTDGKKVYSSSDSGRSWTNRSGSLPNVACHTIAVDENNTVYVGTDVGVFVRPATEIDWQPFLNGMPRAPVSELLVNNTANTLIATTFGRGNFKTSYYTTCPVSGTLLLGGTLTGQRFYEFQSIASTSLITGGAGTDVAMKGIDYVQLNPGFEAKSNNLFKAYIGPCGNGGVPFTMASLNDEIRMDQFYIPAENGKMFPFAKISNVNNATHTATVVVNESGVYTLRIDNTEGAPTAFPLKSITLSAGKHEIDLGAFGSGSFYLQLIKDNRPVHYQEYIPL